MAWPHLVARGVTELYGRARRVRPPRGLRVLLYHMIGTRCAHDRYGMCVAPERFTLHMEALAHDAQFALAPLEAVPRLQFERPLTAVTFDDGYRDTLTTAAPVLARWGMPFTVFVVPRHVMSGQPIYLSPDDLKELADLPGCTIGSHGWSHRRLTDVDETVLRQELRDSRAWLEELLQKPVVSIAYPYGAVNQRVRAEAADAGYSIGACSRTGVNDARRDPLLLCRTEIVGADSLRVFRQKLTGGWDWHRFRHPDPANDWRLQASTSSVSHVDDDLRSPVS